MAQTPEYGATGAQSIADSLTSREWDRLVDVVLHRLERRAADELSRRGRRVRVERY